LQIGEGGDVYDFSDGQSSNYEGQLHFKTAGNEEDGGHEDGFSTVMLKLADTVDERQFKSRIFANNNNLF